MIDVVILVLLKDNTHLLIIGIFERSNFFTKGIDVCKYVFANTEFCHSRKKPQIGLSKLYTVKI